LQTTTTTTPAPIPTKTPTTTASEAPTAAAAEAPTTAASEAPTTAASETPTTALEIPSATSDAPITPAAPAAIGCPRENTTTIVREALPTNAALGTTGEAGNIPRADTYECITVVYTFEILQLFTWYVINTSPVRVPARIEAVDFSGSVLHTKNV
jgi:hypothetical protein